jgi:Tol biopolymer transport system component/tRNA A-37 threonylcarbamoyl transferase component Bud32
MIGTTLGHYRILDTLGKGGMGEVYLAEDSSLDRRVALKVLAPSLAADADRRERFVREAKAVAALNHPNIVTVHSVEHAGDVHFLTMELVEGRTLGELIPATGLPLDRLLGLAIPLADAVAAAHDRGITHRDLKPANVMVTTDGRLKVLDFGLAKLAMASGPLGSDETALGPSLLTGEGRIVGTVSYMSPEQAEGKAVDHRSDIFSLGVMLYEMATAARPFTGDTSLSVLSAIVKDTPRPVTDLNPRVPRELGRVIRRCLVKDPEQRFQSAKDLRNELQELQRDVASGEVDAPSPAALATAPPKRGAALRVATWAAAGAAVITIAALVVPGLLQAPAAPVSATFTQLTFQAGIESLPSLSPDGKWVVYTAGPQGNLDIMLQSVGGQNTINLTKDSPVNDAQPAFSPNGDLIAFRSARQGGGIFVMGRTGEFVRRVSDTGFTPSWSPDGASLAFATEFTASPYGRIGVSELWIVTVASGEKRLVSKGDAMEPRWSPNGRLIAYWAVPHGTSRRDIFVIPATGGTPVAVTHDEPLDSNPIWAPDGRSLYFVSDRGGSLNLWQIPVDPGSGTPAGPPTPITIPAQSVNHLSASADGRQIVFEAGTVSSNVQRFAFEPAAGAITGEGAWVTRGSRYITDIHVSPNGERLVYRAGNTQEDLFVSQTDGSREQQLTSDQSRDRYPRWSPDGGRIAFYSDRTGPYEVWTIAPDGGSLRQVSDSKDATGLGYPFWSPDGTRIAGTDLRRFVVTVFDPNVTWSAQKLEQLPTPPGNGRFLGWSWSPDHRKIAGWLQGAVMVYDTGTKAYQTLPNARGTEPVWLPDNRRLLYHGGNQVFLVDIVTGIVKEILSTGTDLVRDISVTHDGRQLFVAHGETEADIWMARLK